MRGIRSWMGVALVGSAVAVNVRAAEPTLEELDQKVKVLERKLELADEAATSKAKEAVSVKAGKEGFSLTSADKAFQLKLRGYVQADGRFFLDDSERKATDTFVLRRVRPILEGKVYNDFGFKIMPDFGGGQTVLQDAYGDYTPAPELSLRVGKFKPPVGLERLQSGTDLEFIERGLPTLLVPNRDVGVQLGGEIASGVVQYAVGVFNGVPDGGNGDVDTNDGKDFAGRLFLHPFRAGDVESLQNFGFGVAGSIGDHEGTGAAPGLSTFRTTGQQSFFSFRSTATNAADSVYADGNHTRLSPQAYWYAGSFGLFGEWVSSEQDVTRGKESDTIANEAWQVLGSWVLTGEDASYKGVTPLWNFDPATGHWGAFELVARLHQLTVDDAAFPKFADSKKSAKSVEGWGAGLNWYLSRNVKASLDFDTLAFEGGTADGDRPDEQIVFTRVQYAF